MARDQGGRQTLFFTYSKEPLTQELVSSNSRNLEDFLIEEQNKVDLQGESSEYFRIPLDLRFEDLAANTEEAGITCLTDIVVTNDDDDNAFDALVQAGFTWDEYCGRHLGSTQPMFQLDAKPIHLNVFSLIREFGNPDLDGISCHGLDLELDKGTSRLVDSIDVASLKRLTTLSPLMELLNGHYLQRAYSYRRPSFGLGHLRLSPQKDFDPTMLRVLIHEDAPNFCAGISYGLVEPEFSLREEAGGDIEANEFYVLNHKIYETLEEVIAALNTGST